MSAILKLATYLENKPNFIRVGTTFFGLGMAAVGLALFGGYGGVGWWLVIVLAAMFSGWIWAQGMWLIYEPISRKTIRSERGNPRKDL